MKQYKIECCTRIKGSVQENLEPFYPGAAEEVENAQQDQMLY